MSTRFSRRHALKTLSVLGLGGLGSWALSSLSPRQAIAAARSTPAANVMTETRALMGTFVAITLADPSNDRMRDAMGRAFERMISLIAIYDRFDASSPVSLLNRHGRLTSLDCPPELAALLERSQRFEAATGGAFNITVRPLVDLFRRYQNPTGAISIPENELNEARALVRADGLTLNGRQARLAQSGMGVTLDGIAKGHIADEISRFLLSLGLDNHLINAGGDIVAHGAKAPGQPWRVAVQNPSGGLREGAFALANQAIATSGSYQIFFDASRRHHHLIQPGSGASPTDVVSVSVLAKTALEADALATSLAVMPPRDALGLISSLPGRACLLLTADGRALASPLWPA